MRRRNAKDGMPRLSMEKVQSAGERGKAYQSKGGGGAVKRESAGSKGLMANLFWVLALGLLLAAHSIVVFQSNNLPTAAPMSSRAFSEERAFRHLNVLSNTIGVRCVGTPENEVEAVQYIHKQLQEVQKLTKGTRYHLDLSVQKSRGAFQRRNARVPSSFGRFDKIFRYQTGFYGSYHNLTNVVARLRMDDARSANNGSLLISAHFDTANGSPGASDDTVGIAVMLDMCRSLILSDADIHHPVVFNFNGGEETGLHAAHGFISGHEYGKDIRAFINLEAVGNGGKEILFQSTDVRMSELYTSSAPHPHGNVIGQDLFSANAIPGDTDYRIYKERVPGLDLAFYRHGNLYHTPYDNVESISQGSIQHMGDNVLAMIVNAQHNDDLFSVDADNIDIKADAGVFFDFLGLYANTFVIQAVQTSNYIVVCFSVGTVLFSIVCGSGAGSGNGRSRFTVIDRVLSLVASISGIVLSCCCSLALALALSYFVSIGLSLPLTWYSRQYVAWLLYGLPSIGCFVYLYTKWCTYFLPLRSSPHSSHSHPITGIVTHQAVLLVTAFFATLLTRYALGSSYIFAGWCVAFSCSLLLRIAVSSFATEQSSESSLLPLLHFLIFAVATALPYVHSHDMMMCLVDTLISGAVSKLGANRNPDVVVAVLMCLVALVGVVPLSPYFGIPTKRSTRFLVRSLFLVSAIALLVLFLVPSLSFPFYNYVPPPSESPSAASSSGQEHYIKRLYLSHFIADKTSRHLHAKWAGAPVDTHKGTDDRDEVSYVLIAPLDRAYNSHVRSSIDSDLPPGVSSGVPLAGAESSHTTYAVPSPTTITPPTIRAREILSERHLPDGARLLEVTVSHPATQHSVVYIKTGSMLGWTLTDEQLIYTSSGRAIENVLTTKRDGGTTGDRGEDDEHVVISHVGGVGHEWSFQVATDGPLQVELIGRYYQEEDFTSEFTHILHRGLPRWYAGYASPVTCYATGWTL